MSVLNLLCPICTDIFRNVEDIHSTSCGHVFHLQCMSQWRKRSASCPKCRSPNPTTFKLYLSFDETADTVKELRKELENSAHQINEWKTKIGELQDNSDQEITKLKKKFNDKHISLCKMRAESETEIAALKDQVQSIEGLKKTIAMLEKHNNELFNKITALKASSKTLEDSFDLIADLKADLAVSEKNKLSTDMTRQLKEEMLTLEQDLEKKTAQLEREVSKNAHLTIECIQMKAMNVSKDSDSSDSTELMKHEEKIKELEHRLNHISKEFEKEITKNTQLEIDKVKLQSYIGRMQLNSSTASMELNDPMSSRNCLLKTPSIASSSESLNSNHREQINWRNCLGDKVGNSSSASFEGKKTVPLASLRRDINNKTSFKKISAQQSDHFYDSSNSIVIQNYPKDYMIYPLENIVRTLAINMAIHLNVHDISKVNIMGGNIRNLGDRVSLFVRFNHRDMKLQFLGNKNRLSSSNLLYLRAVKIKEFFDDRIHDVFLYAKAKLSGNGFDDVFCTNNKIFAKRDVSESIGLRIHTRQQVDEIINSSMSCVLLETIEI